jgi:Tol biopolymer transport system component
VDASVALGPDPHCAASVAATKDLGPGANPVLAADGSALWFDAPGPDGRRQIHRIQLASGERTCWTCEEPGSNRRPHLAPNGAAILYETDRHAGAFAPVNWDLYLTSARGSVSTGPRRLSYDPAPDAFGSFDPGGRLVVWSSGAAGRYAIATAPLRSGHGGLLLGAPAALVPGGAAWIAPLAWSPDARTLVALRGDPFGVQETFALDPATGRKAPLSRAGAKTVAASFSADGTSLALATTHPAAAAAALPEALGFLVGRVASLRGADGARFRGTGVRIGAPWAQELAEVELGEIADFGSPAGIALAPDARSFVLAQRRSEGAEAADERMLRVDLDCP